MKSATGQMSVPVPGADESPRGLPPDRSPENWPVRWSESRLLTRRGSAGTPRGLESAASLGGGGRGNHRAPRGAPRHSALPEL